MATLTVGKGQQFSTIAAAVSASRDGDVVAVNAGTYVDDFVTVNTRITIQGVGGMVELVAAHQPPNGKGIFVTNTDVTIDHLAFSGSTVPDGNGAGIRYQGGNLTILNSYFHDNQNGLLANPVADGTITIRNSEFSHNGSGDGYTHNLYVGEIASLTIDGSYFHDAVIGHEIKSRAHSTTITNSRIVDGNTGTASYSVDLPNGGRAVLSGNLIEQGPQSDNPAIVHFGGEGSAYSDSSLRMTGNTVVNDLASGNARLVVNQTSVTVSLADTKVIGLSSGQMASGPASVSGTDILSSRPAIDTSSPWAGTASPTPSNPTPTTPTPTPAPAGSTTVGSGADSLVLKVSEQAWNGDAQFTVKVDGVQVGGTFTAKASHAAGLSDTFTLKGNWGAGAHKVEVAFVNDGWNGNLVEDRNLYLDGVTFNGKTVAGGDVDMLSGGVVKLNVPASPSTTPAPAGSTTVGGGPDSLVLKVSEQAWNGDAQFTVKVDGVQVGGTFTAKASHAAGLSDTFTLKGNWGAGAHKVEVAFVNDGWNGNLVEDRNLYLDGVTFNGKTVAGGAVDMLSGGVVKLDVAATAAPAPSGSGTTIGAGKDVLVVKVSEQAWQGDAQFVVKVDGVQVGDTLTATASHAHGHSDTFTLKGNWGSAAHTVEVNFVNDGWNGNLVEDRNLYLDGVSFNGKAVPASTVDMLSGGAVLLSVPQSVISGDAAANTIKGTDFADHIKGLAGNDTLHGGAGDDTLDGGTGADLMFGGAGNDTYVVDNAGDVPTELAGAGYDTVTSSISWTLGANLERLNLVGTAVSATGNELDNVLVGNNLANVLNGMAGNDRLQGGGGNDVLIGGLGHDILEGGAGADVFRYAKPSEGGDTILDFVPREDVIEISASGFGGGLSTSTDLASAARFVANTTGQSNAPAGTGQFVYETDTAKLWWDADGSGAGAATEIATFAAGTVLSHGDIHLIG